MDDEPAPPANGVKNVVVLASGSGTLLQALLDDTLAVDTLPADTLAVDTLPDDTRPDDTQPDDTLSDQRDPQPYRIAAVGSDRKTCRALDRAEAAGVPTFVCLLSEHADRQDWDRGLSVLTASFNADLVVLAGFMKLVGADFLAAFPNRVINAHPSLLPAFPGMQAPADALAHGVKLTGCTLFLVDGGIDAGPIVAQRAVPVHDDDDATSLHERIKVAERELLPQVVRSMTGGTYTVSGRKVRIE